MDCCAFEENEQERVDQNYFRVYILNYFRIYILNYIRTRTYYIIDLLIYSVWNCNSLHEPCLQRDCSLQGYAHSGTECSLNIVFFQKFQNIFRTLASLGFPSVGTSDFMLGPLNGRRSPALQQNWQSPEIPI